MSPLVTATQTSLAPNTLAGGPMMPRATRPRWRRMRRRALWLGGVSLVLAGLVLAHRPLLTAFAWQFRVDDPVPGDAIVVLLGGPSHRPSLAAELYSLHIAPAILMGSSKDDSALGFSETSLSREAMIRQGVPADAIHLLPGIVTSTREEACAVRDYIRAHPGVRRITIVTTAFHTARARWIFRRVLRGLDVQIHMAAARQPEFDERDWFTKDEGMVVYFSEAIKTVYYRLVY